MLREYSKVLGAYRDLVYTIRDYLKDNLGEYSERVLREDELMAVEETMKEADKLLVQSARHASVETSESFPFLEKAEYTLRRLKSALGSTDLEQAYRLCLDELHNRDEYLEELLKSIRVGKKKG